MLLWRLSSVAHARAFDGGYGLLHDGRWNTAGRPVTYCATSPALCVLEKLVHVEDPDLMPEMVMVTYEAPNDMSVEGIGLADLPSDWRHEEAHTQQLGDDWHRAARTPLLRMPSAIVPLADSPDMNLLINHRHDDSGRIEIRRVEPFMLDPRLF